MSYYFLQSYWWFIVSLLGALLVFMLFVQGGQSLIYTLGKTEGQLNMLLRSLSRKWELTFTTLVTFGGAFFASFPLFYSTSFGGAYWVWMLLLFTFIVQAVSYEYISHQNNLLGRGTFRAFLFTNGLLAPILIGAAVSTFFHGAQFAVHKENLTNALMPVVSTWTNPLHGLEAVLDFGNGALWNIFLGLAVFFLARVLACLYFINNIEDAEIRAASRKQLLINTVGFLVFFLPYLVRLLFKDGLAIDPATKLIAVESCKYLHNLLALPWAAVLLLAGVVLVLFGIIKSLLKPEFLKGIWFAGIGSVFVVLTLLLMAGLNHTAYYPSLSDPQSSLTIITSSSSQFTLTVMSIVSIIIPFVLAYICHAWWTMDREKIKA